MRRWAVFGIIATGGVLIDQATKLYIDKSMQLFQTIAVIDGFFNFTYVRNKGAAFSFLSQASWRVPFFIAVSAIAAVIIIIAFTRLRKEQQLAQISLAMIFSGAIGNLIDRVRLCEVIDFLDMHFKGRHWPAFNIADSLICIGVILLAVEIMREDKRQKLQASRL